MVRVVEDPTTLAYTTDYLFDTLGNLRKTSQGSQYRYFMHSSLGRLLYAKQVEQTTNGSLSATDPVTGNTAWSVKYLYDDNGNITSTIDASNVTTTATYDALNRLKVRDYGGSTPDVSFYYDGKGLSSVPNYSKGKTTKVTSTASENRYLTFDVFGHILTARQTTASVNYDTEYEYNLSGALTREIYPSGRVVDNTLDANGDLSTVTTRATLGSSSQNRATNFVYNPAGAATSFKFGNNKYENFTYNNRMQVTQIGLGTSTTDTSLLKLEYKYNTTGNTDNNGSMLEQKITVPTVGGSSGFTATQTYTYDALNRLGAATETISTQTWKQEFSYDRYGNRSYVTGTGHTTTLGGCTTACNPTFDAATNRFAGSQGFTYDANGSLTVDAINGQQYTLDAENRQTVLKNSSSVNLAEYSYDGEGKRVRKLVSGTNVVTHFVYDAGGTLIEEWTTTPGESEKDEPSVSTTCYIYAGSRLISTETSSGTTYVTLDHLGSTRVTTDGSGNVTSRKDFMAFGE
jgi:YD repeat-containing protein